MIEGLLWRVLLILHPRKGKHLMGQVFETCCLETTDQMSPIRASDPGIVMLRGMVLAPVLRWVPVGCGCQCASRPAAMSAV